MSPKAAKITSGLLRDGQAVVDASHGKHADRTAGTMDQFDIFRKNILQTEAIDGVRVAAADFHEAVVPIGAGQTADLLGRLRNQFGFAKLINKSHADPPSQAGRGQASIQVGVAYFELGSFNVVGFDVIFVLQAVALDLLHGSIDFAQRAQRVHLVESIATR